MPQSSPSAEHVAAAVLSQVAAGEAHLLSDNLGVVNTSALQDELAFSPNKVHSGTTRFARTQENHTKIVSVKWIPAHRDPKN